MKNDAGDCALFLAAYGRDPEVVAQILAHGADIQSKNNAGHTALHVAAKIYDNRAVMELLLAKGAHLNVKDKTGNTPFDLARHASREKNVAFLKEKGAE